MTFIPRFRLPVAHFRQNSLSLANDQLAHDIDLPKKTSVLLQCPFLRNITIKLTAHGLSDEHFKKSITLGAFAYIPKEKMAYIDVYLADLIRTYQESGRKSGNWFSLLRTYFENKFGSGWFDTGEEFRRNFDSDFLVSREYLGK